MNDEEIITIANTYICLSWVIYGLHIAYSLKKNVIPKKDEYQIVF